MASSATKSHLRTLHHEAAPAVSSPSKQLSDELRQYRDHVGMTPETAAEHLSWPQDRLTQTELGTRRTPKADLDALIRLYEIDHREAKRLHTLRTRASKEPVTVAAPERYQQFQVLQTAASVQYTYAPSLLPPICQVEAYAAELAEPGVPQTPQTVGDLAKYHVQQSQSLLNRRDPFELHVVLGEATLYNLAGTRRTMIKQLDHLTRLARVPHIKLQILPFAETGHAVVDTGYTLLAGDNADTWLCTDSLITTPAPTTPPRSPHIKRRSAHSPPERSTARRASTGWSPSGGATSPPHNDAKTSTTRYADDSGPSSNSPWRSWQ